MSSRETTTFSIKDHKFEVKTYATAKETNLIQSAYFIGAKVEVIGEQPKINEFDPSVQYKVRLEMIRQLIVKMDDSSDNIVGRCEDLPADLFDELASTLDETIAKKKS